MSIIENRYSEFMGVVLLFSCQRQDCSRMALAAFPVAGLNFDLLVLCCDCINTLFMILGLCGKIS